MSCGAATTRPPRRVGVIGGRVGVGDPEVEVPARVGAVGERAHDADDVAGHGLLGLAADVAGQPPQRHLLLGRAERLGLPAEDRPVERGGALRVGRGQHAHRPCARLVDELRALARAGFPGAEDRTGRVGEHGGAAGRRHVEGGLDDGPARLRGQRGGGLGVLDADVGDPAGPGVRRLRRQRREAGDVAAAQARERRTGRRVLSVGDELPAEERAVEAGGGLEVGLEGHDPAGDAGGVGVALAHACAPLAHWLPVV